MSELTCTCSYKLCRDGAKFYTFRDRNCPEHGDAKLYPSPPLVVKFCSRCRKETASRYWVKDGEDDVCGTCADAPVMLGYVKGSR